MCMFQTHLGSQAKFLVRLYSHQVAELTESDAPPAAAQNLSNSNDLASVLSLYIYNSGFLGSMQKFK